MDIGVGRRVAKASTLPLQTSDPLWLCPSRTGAATLLQKVWRGRAARKLAAVLRALPGGPRRGPAEAAGRCADTALLPRTPAEAKGQAGHEHGSAGGRCGTGHTCVKTREVRAAGHRSFHIQTCCSPRCSFRTRKSRGLCPQASAAQHPGDAAQRRRHSGTLAAPPSTMKLPPFIPPPEIPLPCPLSTHHPGILAAPPVTMEKLPTLADPFPLTALLPYTPIIQTLVPLTRPPSPHTNTTSRHMCVAGWCGGVSSYGGHVTWPGSRGEGRRRHRGPSTRGA